ncbi:MAG: bifunctional phosphopantothenoylcysteine decarboxylase/phosphopantothenate--cysteine ligase CoaBC [Dermabacter sp.]|nr:bifunctional phosphopantothenoylcysteine decarboxylase/phosphopantothenate--cysteine ligase CoaBC [Dermabacter sp.]
MPAPSPSGSSAPLAGRRIIVGVCAGIAAYKAAHVVRALAELGADVRVIPTRASLAFVGAATWEALSHNRVSTEVFDDIPDVAHVALGQQADAVVVVPATADFLARARMGRADDLLTASLLVARGPVIVAPAMHTEMWEHPATRDNVEVLIQRGVSIIPPAVGRLTGSDTGAGRLPEPSVIVERVLSCLAAPTAERDLSGRHIVISAGGTREALDPVRVLTNHSTGRQGVALAHAALVRGARVTLVLAHAEVEPPTGVELVRVSSAAELARAIAAHAPGADAVIMAAAVSDFTAEAAPTKVKKNDGASLVLHLTQTEDILRSLVTERGTRGGPRVIVGFAAETGDETSSALAYAQAKARAKGADLLAFNDVSVYAFGSPTNHVSILDADGRILETHEGTKHEVAHGLVSAIAERLRHNGAAESAGR